VSSLTSTIRSSRTAKRRSIHLLSRTITVVLVAVVLGTFFWTPETPLEWAADILLRTYLMFLGTVMAHEASHGQMGSTRRSNFFWGRLALVPSTVPYVNFRKTHLMHHAHTNDPVLDPDYFVKPNHWWEAPFRAILVPHNWIMWLRARGRIKRRDIVEWGFHYLLIFALYLAIISVVGLGRVALGLLPALWLVSLLLWYPFAYFTHEGYSTGESEHQSHNYYGHAMFWLTLGLSMHRVHHEHPRLTWLEALPYVEEDPRGFFAGLRLGRDIRPEPANSSAA
jgi:fatty acid desaturase